MSFKFKFTNLQKKIQGMVKLPGLIDDCVSETLFSVMDVEVAGRAKEEFVPVKTGELKGSIHTTKPKVTTGGVSVSVVAGGPAAPYALRVHEWLGPGVRWSVPGTGPKYIEKPLLAAIPGMDRALGDCLEKAMKQSLK